MTSSKLTVALAVTGAVALASGAYALGSQAGDGDAAAAKTPNAAPFGYGPGPGRPGFGRFHGGGGPDLSGLADRLGVSEDKLRQALQDLRPAQRPQGMRDDLAQELADALGIDVSKVSAAFDKLRPRHDGRARGDLAAALAKQLGLSTDKVQNALDAQRDHRGSPRALAEALGVTPAELRQAFAKLFREHRRDHVRRGPATAALASELGVTQARLKAAFDKLRAVKEKEFADKRAEFARQLAAKLGIDASKVEKALEARMGFRGFRGGP